jgi:hypothetical protein
VLSLLALLLASLPSTALAQRPPSDTSRAQQQRAQQQRAQQQQEPLRPLPLQWSRYGRVVIDSLPARRPWTTFEYIANQEPGSFLYDLGPVSWPHGWSVDGLAPHRWALRLDGFSYTNPLTGRPQVEVLPPSFFYPPRIGVDPGGRPTGVHLDGRDYLLRPPITELRFRRDSNGLQSIAVAHSQQHRVDLFDTPALVQITGGFGGQAAEGAYTGSDLRSGRRLWARLRYRTNRWEVALSDLSIRHRIGARGEVEPPIPSLFASIYLFPLAETSVRSPDARRRTFRNDLMLTVRGPVLPFFKQPLRLSGRWSAQTFEFEPDFGGSMPDTAWSVRTHGFHGLAQQEATIGRHDLLLEASASTWTTARSNVAQIDGQRWEAHASVQDSVRVGRTALALNGGWHASSVQTHPSAALRVRRSLGGVDWRAAVSAAGQPLPWMMSDGFETLVQPLEKDAPSPSDLVYRATLTAQSQLGAVDVRLKGFGNAIKGPLDYYAVVPTGDSLRTIPDTLAARTASDPFLRAGATLALGWRTEAERGLYARAEATAQQFLNASASPLHARQAETLPDLHGRARLGARLVLFKDLITDIWVQARGWTAMNSRWFHPPTGLLSVPPLDQPVPDRPDRRVGPNGVVDVHAETILRGAKLFFTFENITSDTQVHRGTFVVPVYPLPTLRFRFGVHWGILN